LGGIGTGAIRFCAHQGSFFAADSAPCGMGDFQPLPRSCLQLYTNRNGTVKTVEQLRAIVTDGRVDDDAIYPTHSVNFGGVNDVTVTLFAYAPVCFDSMELMCFPYAFFEVTLVNNTATPVDAAVAMQLGTRQAPLEVPGRGIVAAGTVERALYAAAGSGSAAIVSSGGDDGFFASGQCTSFNDSICRVAAKLALPAADSQTVTFVYAWYNRADTGRYYYTNFFPGAGSVAECGCQIIRRFRDNAAAIVRRMRASDMPAWVVDHTLNSLCNLTTNSIYTRDGRHCYTEGMWSTNGTMDQMWHARPAMIMTVPDLVWQELSWWARTQKTDPAGQIHHDMGDPMSQLWGWDDRQHPEYAYQPDCNRWVDLNCAFIISVYEAYCATADRERLDYFWPYVKKSAQRILDQVEQYGDTTGYPYTFISSLNSYDQEGIDPNPFNAGLSTAAYKIMTVLAELYRDDSLKQRYQNAFDTVKISYQTKYLSGAFSPGRFSETLLAGQWIGWYLKFGDYYDSLSIDRGLGIMEAYYQPTTKGIGFPGGSYEEWAPYLISHLGGICLQTGRFDLWRALQHDWYERNYSDRNHVFNQQLGIPIKVTAPNYFATDPSVYNQYISIPVLWRNYSTLLGYRRNKATGEIWLEPIIPPEMEHSIRNGFYLSPEGCGTISAMEGGIDFVNTDITFTPDSPLAVTAIYLRDKSAQQVTVTVDGVARPAIRINKGYAKELKVDYSGTVDSPGIVVSVVYEGAGIDGNNRLIFRGHRRHTLQSVLTNGRLFIPWAGKEARASVRLYTIAGRLAAQTITDRSAVDIRRDLGASEGVYIARITGLR
ncbi:MAG: hypothetical protein JXA18_08225, partial [Chitinispirillaceae bacterium]|nr:hypothetical protein [Chitinispirillaceae bacterium]